MADAQYEKKVISFRIFDGNTVKFEYNSSLPSTASAARSYAESGYPDRYVVFSETQPSSQNSSKNEKGIFMSCILRPSIFSSQAGFLGPLSTVALCTALEEHMDKKLGIGWVNSIFCDGLKIGECFVEGKLDNFTSYEYLIVTFSVKLNEKYFTPRLTDMMRKVFEEDNFSIEMIIAKTILNKFFATYRDLKDPMKHMDTYKKKFVLFDKKIKYISEGKKKNATVSDIESETCALIITAKDGTKLRIASPSSVIIPNRI